MISVAKVQPFLITTKYFANYFIIQAFIYRLHVQSSAHLAHAGRVGFLAVFVVDFMFFDVGGVFEHEGEPAQWIGYIESGYFKYVVHNRITGKDYSMAFVFNGEMVGDYPFCFYGDQSDVDIVAGEDSTVYVMDGKEFNQLFEENIDTMRMGKQYAEHLFIQAYTRLLNFYRTDAQTRYEQLVQRCPNIVQKLPLQEIASYLRVTPTTVSSIRKKMLG